MFRLVATVVATAAIAAVAVMGLFYSPLTSAAILAALVVFTILLSLGFSKAEGNE